MVSPSPRIRAAAASSTMRGSSSAWSNVSLPGSKRGWMAESFTEMLGRAIRLTPSAGGGPARFPIASIAHR